MRETRRDRPQDPGPEQLAEEHQAELLDLARAAIASALDKDQQAPDRRDYSGPLAHRRAAFVTLKKSGALRGCIGTLEAREPLAITVADCAVGAALRDPRFPALAVEELRQVQVSVSVLDAPRPMVTGERAELLSELRPGTDGLILEWQRHRATFLPQVWEQLPEPEDFLAQLLKKAELPPDFWSPELRLQRYGSFSFSEPMPRNPVP